MIVLPNMIMNEFFLIFSSRKKIEFIKNEWAFVIWVFGTCPPAFWTFKIEIPRQYSIAYYKYSSIFRKQILLALKRVQEVRNWLRIQERNQINVNTTFWRFWKIAEIMYVRTHACTQTRARTQMKVIYLKRRRNKLHNEYKNFEFRAS